jgi:hypothetical protein
MGKARRRWGRCGPPHGGRARARTAHSASGGFAYRPPAQLWGNDHGILGYGPVGDLTFPQVNPLSRASTNAAGVLTLAPPGPAPPETSA